jgi:hypothetical protein
VGLINKTNDPRATFRNAGGCIRWHWDEDIKREMTTETAKFVKQLMIKGLDLSAIEDNYFLVYKSEYTPALNIKGASLVNYFLECAQENGVDIINDEIIDIENSEIGKIVRTSENKFTAKKITAQQWAFKMKNLCLI